MPEKNYLPPAIFLMGPTASGKSHIALEIAEQFPVEIVSVDSAQVYRFMDIGTAKPDRATLGRAPHHLIDLIDPTEHYSAARFRSDALNVMHGITGRGRIPLLVGGTMLYFQALLNGLSVLPEADEALRAVIEDEARISGWPAMHAKLNELDSESEDHILQTLRKLADNYLLIQVSHREPVRLLADAVLEIRDGQLRRRQNHAD